MRPPTYVVAQMTANFENLENASPLTYPEGPVANILERLPAFEQQMIKTSSVLGRSCARVMLQAIMGEPDNNLISRGATI